MKWIKKFFERKEKVSAKKEIDLSEEIDDAIKKYNNERVKNFDEIDDLRKWAADLIQEVFYVPKDFWYEEIEKYFEIKNLDKNKSLPQHILDETDNIIKGYIAQINLRRKKIELCDLSIEKHKKLYEKYQNTEKKLADFESYRHLEEEFDKHNNKLFDLETNIEVNNSIDLETLENQGKNIEEELEVQKEVYKQIEILQKKYGLKNDFFHAEIFTNEINKIINNINQKDND